MELKELFTKSYDRALFKEHVLKPIFLGRVRDFKLYDADGEQEKPLTEKEERTAKKVVKYGEIEIDDNRKIDLYEVTVQDSKNVATGRVGLAALVKKLIIGNNAVFAIFKYENAKNP